MNTNQINAIVKSVTSLLWPRLDDGKEPLKHLDLALELAVSLSELGYLGADGPRSEGGRRILLDNSRVYVRFLPFLNGRFHLGRLGASQPH